MVKRILVIILLCVCPVITADSTGVIVDNKSSHDICSDPAKMLDVSIVYSSFVGLSFSYERGVFRDVYSNSTDRFLAFDLTALYTFTDTQYNHGVSRLYLDKLGITLPDSPKKYATFLMSMINDDNFRGYMYIWYRDFGKVSEFSQNPRVLQAFLFAQQMLEGKLLDLDIGYSVMNDRAMSDSRRAVYLLGIAKACTEDYNIDVFKRG